MHRVSVLRKEKQAKRVASPGKPSQFQKAVAWTYEFLLLCLAFWGYKSLAGYMSVWVTILGGVIVAIVWVALDLFLRKHPQTWVTGNQIEIISSIPRRGKMILIMIALSLAVPRLVDFFWRPPPVEIVLKKAPGHNAVGFDVDGVSWRENFLDYRLFVRNDANRIENLRIELTFPGMGVVKSTVLVAKGAESVSAAPHGLTAAKGNQQGQRVAPVDAYSMNLLVSSIRMLSDGDFATRIILVDSFAGKTVTGEKPKGDIFFSYYYEDFWGQTKKHSAYYPLTQKMEGKESSLTIDTASPIPPETHRLRPGTVFDPGQKAKDLNVILSPNP
jgi:hypothetical protein